MGQGDGPGGPRSEPEVQLALFPVRAPTPGLGGRVAYPPWTLTPWELKTVFLALMQEVSIGSESFLSFECLPLELPMKDRPSSGGTRL